MTQTLATRASSLGAAVCLLGALLGVALTATYQIAAQTTPDVVVPIVLTTPEPPPKPPVPQPPTHAAPLAPLGIAIAPLIPIVDAPPRATETFVPPQPARITQPVWAHVPRDLDRFYPRAALRQNLKGRAVLECLVATTGALACAIASETPAGWGFGAAALQIASEYRMQPAMRDGVPVEGRYRMVVPFDLRS